MADEIGSLFVKLGFRSDDSALNDFNNKINQTFGNIQSISNITSTRFGTDIASGLYTAATAAGTAATSIENLSRNTKMATDDIQKLMGAFRISNPNASEGQALGMVNSFHDFFVNLTTKRDPSATTAWEYLGGKTPPVNEMDALNQIRAGYSQALERDKNTGRFLANPYLSQVFGSPDAVAMMGMSQSEFDAAGDKAKMSGRDLSQLEEEKRAVNTLDVAWKNLERSMLSLAASPLIKMMSAISNTLGKINENGVGGYVHEAERGMVDVLQNPKSSTIDKLKALAGLPLTGLYEMGSSVSKLAGGTPSKEDEAFLKSYNPEKTSFSEDARAARIAYQHLFNNNNDDVSKDNDVSKMSSTQKHEHVKKLLVNMGAPEIAAEGIVRRLTKESSLDEHAFNPNGGGRGAKGIAQWRGSRLDDFEEFSGHDIDKSTMEEQVQFLYYELTKGHEKKAGNAIFAAKNYAQGEQLTKDLYERPTVNVTLNQQIHTSDPALAADLSVSKTKDAILTSQQMTNPRNGTR
jgi:hypothetical protein